VILFDGSVQRPHPEEPAALRARLRRDYQANVRLGQDGALIRQRLWALASWPARRIARWRHGEPGGSRD